MSNATDNRQSTDLIGGRIIESIMTVVEDEELRRELYRTLIGRVAVHGLAHQVDPVFDAAFRESWDESMAKRREI